MAPGGSNYVVRRETNPTATTGEGGMLIDMHGNRWREVSAYGPDQTGVRRARIVQDGRTVGYAESA